MSSKKFRDPVYGYVEISGNIVHEVIDTDVFQRLRNIRQTSYAPLYPASLHNRFVHSIGVYHLGKIAFEAIYQSTLYYKNSSDDIMNTLNDIFSKEEWQHYRELFELACLLHDVGHSPFSHTGEKFFETSKSNYKIEVDDKIFDERIAKSSTNEEKISIKKEWQKAKEYTYRKHLAQITKDDAFDSLIARDTAAEHELMSCIVAIESFGQLNCFSSYEDKAFFARCITGLLYQNISDLTVDKYENMDNKEHTRNKRLLLLDCFIQLLHSSVIDVDRLDYIIRDADTMGYQTVSIDYERLLKGLVIIKKDEYNFAVGFHKNAISIIENAVYAHDSEKKWIQGHPCILYDNFLIQNAIISIEDRIKADYSDATSTLFSYDSLTNSGSKFENLKIRYLADEDVLYLMKNVYESKYSEEYFDRSKRRLPIWKSEAEFKNLFNAEERKIINEAIETVMKGDNKDFLEITESNILSIDKDIERAEKTDLGNMVKAQKQKKKYIEAILTVCKDFQIEGNLALISTKFFKSNFSKGEVENLIILFPNGKKQCLLKDVSSTLSSSSHINDKFIYMYYYPKSGRQKVNTKTFTDALINAFLKIVK